jgi:hypothetical protein
LKSHPGTGLKKSTSQKTSELKKPLTDVFDAVIKTNVMTNNFISNASGDMEEGQTVRRTFGNIGENGVSFAVKI